MARLIAIDPGTRLCGYAVFVEDKPTHVGIVKADKECTSVSWRAANMGYWLANEFREGFHIAFNSVVVERPVIYPGSRERDSDIVDLAIAAGVVGGARYADAARVEGQRAEVDP